jgi:hypothetical protein
MEQSNEYSRAVTRQVEGIGFMRHAKNGALVLCLFVLYCVLLSQGLKASAGSAFFGALAAVPLTVHLYHRLWPPEISDEHRRRPDRRAASIRAGDVEGEYESSGIDGRSGRGE